MNGILNAEIGRQRYADLLREAQNERLVRATQPEHEPSAPPRQTWFARALASLAPRRARSTSRPRPEPAAS
jgi:hypothetical protein